MKQLTGRSVFGNSLTDINNDYIEIFKDKTEIDALKSLIITYGRAPTFQKDNKFSSIIIENIDSLKSVAIIGSNFPLTYMYNLKKHFKDVHFKVIDFSRIFEVTLEYSQFLFDVEFHKVNPLFNDLTDLIKDVDLIIYPETELLVPFNMLKYKNKGNIFCSNYYYYFNDPLALNVVCSEDELEEICLLKSKVKGNIKLNNGEYIRPAFYCLGSSH
jgi:hypothetical protein